MTLFFQTFFKNPKADWKYIVGYEPALMPDEDFAVYRRVLWNFGDVKAYKPWVDKMRPPDRLVIRGARGAPPNIPQLDWEYGVSGIWIGRVPRTNTPARRTAAHRSGDRHAGKSDQCGEFSEVTARRTFAPESKSFSVKPPASCVVSVSVTLFQRMSMSG